ncbi:ribbon-helix-helix domain-containing protein [Candidatus Laterigemmans baculatus]|uniref:ribbon-helix-helix domain-containing protein n=1 Tax=Candidatus Laterigemmans baculatus TaxID=2770505 RepID=UPI0013DCC693|nr:CopG family transcriptional regulator [Candidatus Laterigemmans baculatus]
MEIHLPPDQRAIVEHLVASGRFRSADEALAEGVRLLASAEKLREEVEVGIQQADRGELVDHDTVFARLRTLADAGMPRNP